METQRELDHNDEFPMNRSFVAQQAAGHLDQFEREKMRPMERKEQRSAPRSRLTFTSAIQFQKQTKSHRPIKSASNHAQQQIIEQDKLLLYRRTRRGVGVGVRVGVAQSCTRKAGSIWGAQGIVLALVLSLSLVHLIARQTVALETSSNQVNVSNEQDLRQNSNERRADESVGEQASKAEQANKSEQSSIVASLSSALASAAAAAAVAAAQAHSLSASDARSVAAASNALHRQQHQAAHQRSQGVHHLAIKLADSIPEVPYNILHSMKKLDHAAPFYNIPNAAGSATKADGLLLSGGPNSFLRSALLSVAHQTAHHNRFSGPAASHIGQLLRSPFWKRLADGYDGFASEFRSIFKQSGSAPHHGGLVRPARGPTSTTSRLIRDISGPALLVLLASGLMKNPFDSSGPVRTRRKSQALLAPSLELPNLSGVRPAAQLFAETLANSPLSNQVARLQPAPLQPDQQAAASPLNGFAQTLQHSAATNQLSERNLQAQQGQPTQMELNYNPQPPTGSSNWQQTPFNVADKSTHQASQAIADLVSPTSGNTNFNQQPFEPHQMAGHLMSATNDLSPMQLPLFNSLATDQLANNRFPMAFAMKRLGDGVSISEQTRQMEKRADVFESSPSSVKQTDKSAPLLAKLSPFVHSRAANSFQLVGRSGAQQRSSSSEVDTNEQSSFMAKQLAAAKRLLFSATQQNQNDYNNFQFGDATSELATKQALSAQQRDLTKLLPESWRELAKRTMSSLQQQASSQWKTVEGQLSSWVQEKLKTVAASAPSVQPANSSAPIVSNLIASVSSGAMNILGLNNNSNNNNNNNNKHSSSSTGQQQAAAGSRSSAKPSADSEPHAANSEPKPVRSLVSNVANMLAHSLGANSKSPTASSSSSQASFPSYTILTETDKKGADESRQSVASQYPTMKSPSSEEAKPAADKPTQGATSTATSAARSSNSPKATD